MSTWISRHPYFAACPALVLVLGLAGCDDAAAPFSAEAMGFASNRASQQLTQLSLVGGAVAISTPRGYCIDRRSVRRGADSAFALIARCDTLGATGNLAGRDPAIVTVTIARQKTGASAPTVAQLRNAASPAKMLETRTNKDLVLLRLKSAAAKIPGVSPEHWRGAFALNGYLVGLGLYAPEDSPMLRRNGAEILRDLTRRTRSASRVENSQTVPLPSQNGTASSNSG